MTNNDIILWLWSPGLPILIVVGAYIAMRLHERSLKR